MERSQHNSNALATFFTYFIRLYELCLRLFIARKSCLCGLCPLATCLIQSYFMISIEIRMYSIVFALIYLFVIKIKLGIRILQNHHIEGLIFKECFTQIEEIYPCCFLLFKHCGNLSALNVHGRGKKIRVSFVSDVRETAQGFNLNWTGKALLPLRILQFNVSRLLLYRLNMKTQNYDTILYSFFRFV